MHDENTSPSEELDSQYGNFFREYAYRLNSDTDSRDRIISYVLDWVEGIPPPRPGYDRED